MKPHCTHFSDCGCLTARYSALLEAARAMRDAFERELSAIPETRAEARAHTVEAWRGLVDAIDAVEEGQ